MSPTPHILWQSYPMQCGIHRNTKCNMTTTHYQPFTNSAISRDLAASTHQGRKFISCTAPTALSVVTISVLSFRSNLASIRYHVDAKEPLNIALNHTNFELIYHFATFK